MFSADLCALPHITQWTRRDDLIRLLASCSIKLAELHLGVLVAWDPQQSLRQHWRTVRDC